MQVDVSFNNLKNIYNIEKYSYSKLMQVYNVFT